MSTRERILTIRLLEKVRLDPEFARRLGLEIPEEGLTGSAGEMP